MKNILVIGCGLIGSSLVKAIKFKKISQNIYVIEKSRQYLQILRKSNLHCKVYRPRQDNKKIFDLIIICTPMSQYKNVIKTIYNNIGKKTLISDVGSTKTRYLKELRFLLGKKSKNFISAHPIAGSEVSGPEFGDQNLFKKKWCVIIKEKRIEKKKLMKLKSFWTKLGSKVVVMKADEHDEIFSVTSHLPHLIAYNLVKTAKDFEKTKKKQLIKYSAGGLRDFSRIAASNEIMWRDIFFSNRKNLVKVIQLFINNLKSFKQNIVKNNDKSILKKLKETKKVRKQIIYLKQDINKPDFGR